MTKLPRVVEYPAVRSQVQMEHEVSRSVSRDADSIVAAVNFSTSVEPCAGVNDLKLAFLHYTRVRGDRPPGHQSTLDFTSLPVHSPRARGVLTKATSLPGRSLYVLKTSVAAPGPRSI